MTLDHAGKIAFPGLYEPTHLIGRLAYPLFAGIIGWRLARSPGLAGHYLRWLLPWALLSQPAYVLAGRDWHEGNILFTLAFGVVAWLGWRAARDRHPWRAVALLIAAVAGGSQVEYGVAGVAMLVATAALAERSPDLALALVGPLGVLANFVPSPPHFEAADLAALGASAVMMISAAGGRRLARSPRILFYAYYPLHLLALDWIDRARSLLAGPG